MNKYISYTQAINLALFEAMRLDEKVICYGLGVNDPKRIFGTTVGLEEEFGKERVFDIPTSENAMTGIAIGASLNGIKPVITHQRLDFFLLAMDQLVNGAAKWHYMFGSQFSVPITIRLIVGRGWGQGPTHSQCLHAWFAHIPGLKVVMPTTPKDAKGLLLASIFDPNPIIFIEHRWLHNSLGEVPMKQYMTPLGKANIVTQGTDITIVSMSYLTVEALKATDYLKSRSINCEVIDLRTIMPLDWDIIYSSVRKTGRILALDIGSSTLSLASEIVARVSMKFFGQLKSKPLLIASPDTPEPTSFALTKKYHVRSADIAKAILSIFGIDVSNEIIESLIPPGPHDVPGDWFKGPF